MFRVVIVDLILLVWSYELSKNGADICLLIDMLHTGAMKINSCGRNMVFKHWTKLKLNVC